LGNGEPRLWIMHLPHVGLGFTRIARHRRVTQCLGSLGGKEWLITGAHIDQPVGRSVAEIVAILDGDDLGDGACSNGQAVIGAAFWLAVGPNALRAQSSAEARGRAVDPVVEQTRFAWTLTGQTASGGRVRVSASRPPDRPPGRNFTRASI
jgi:hypothetical protein